MAPPRSAPALLVALSCAAFVAGAAALPHGGGHLPPPPELPPPPSGTGPGPGAPGPTAGPAGPPRGGPATPGGAGPSTPSGPNTPGAGAAAAATAAGGGFDPGDWSAWWELNQFAYLGLREAIWRGAPRTGAGGADPGDASLDLRPSDAALAELVAPALKRVAARERQPEVLSGCLTALAKIGPVRSVGKEASSSEVLLSFLADANQQIRETAALSLGILGGAPVLRELAALLADDERGRELSGGSRVSDRTRAFAAYGLGVFAQRTDAVDLRRFAVHQLAQALERETKGSLDVAVACIHGLSLAELPSKPLDRDAPPLPAAASREALLARELALFDAAELPERALAHLPRALALGIESPDDPSARSVFAALDGVLTRPKAHDRLVLYGAIAALGLVPGAADAELEQRAFDALQRASREGDVLARDFALVSLAQRAGQSGASAELASAAQERLLTVLARGKSRERPWAALALGLLGHGERARGAKPSADVDAALRAALEDCDAPQDAGAYAIALGLRGAVGAAEVVRGKLAQFREDKARGYMALALGMMRDRESTGLLQSILPQAVYRPELIRPLATALALLDDETLVPALVERMRETPSSSVRAVYAWTLANVGDARALEPLLALLEDPEVPTLTRGIAALGLGITCERTLVPWNTELARNANYPAAPSSLFDPAGGGVLNIR